MGKTNTVQYAEKKDQLQVTVDGVDKDGKPTHGVWMGMTDGKTYKVKGTLLGTRWPTKWWMIRPTILPR